MRARARDGLKNRPHVQARVRVGRRFRLVSRVESTSGLGPYDESCVAGQGSSQGWH